MANELRFTTHDGLELAATVAGPQNGQAVLLFHGGGQTRHAWNRTVDVLGRQGYRALAFDHRGHGDSDWSTTYSIELFRDDVLHLARQQNQPPIIVGASLGGIAALLANATALGEISHALVLVDIAPRTNPIGVARILDFMASAPDGFANLKEAAAAVAAYQPQRKQKSDPRGLQKNLRLRDNGRWYWHWDPKALTSFQKESQDEMGADLVYAAAEQLSQPVLLVRGSLSDVIDADITEEFQARIPHSRVVEVSDAGHMVAGDRNDIFSQTIVDFLLTLDSPQAISA